MRWRVIIGLVSIYGIYLLVGAGVFYGLEFWHEERVCQESINELAKYNLTATKQSGDDNSTVDAMEAIGNARDFVKMILTAQQNGVQFDSTSTPSCAHNWNYQNAFFFAGTVITTIGYGNISPRTNGGRIFCIFYAMFGLPLFGIMFSELGAKFARGFNKLDSRMRKKGRDTKLRKFSVIVVAIFTLVVFCLLVPAAIIYAVEDWNYLEAFYYSFITLTTIGFGDFVVGTNPDLTYVSIYRIAVYFWILFGLAYMAAVLSLTSELIKEKAEGKSKNSTQKDGSSDNEDNLDDNSVEGGSSIESKTKSTSSPLELDERKKQSADDVIENKSAVSITCREDVVSVDTNNMFKTDD